MSLKVDTPWDRVFFISDTHWGHANIIKHCGRPFGSLEEMDAAMVANWNQKVGTEDLVFHLGDFCWKGASHGIKVVEQLNGRIILIRGNHDDGCLGSSRFRGRFERIENLLEIKVPEVHEETARFDGLRRITLCHFPMQAWNHSHRGSWHLHGHSHGQCPAPAYMKRIDVGADVWGFTPASYAQVGAAMSVRQPLGDRGGYYD